MASPPHITNPVTNDRAPMAEPEQWPPFEHVARTQQFRVPESIPEHMGPERKASFGSAEFESVVSGGRSAVGGHEHLPNLWSPEIALDVLAKVRALEGWRGLIKWLAESIQTEPRKLLAAHTTTDCQPRKETGPSGDNLGSCGMDNIQSAVGDDGKTMYLC